MKFSKLIIISILILILIGFLISRVIFNNVTNVAYNNVTNVNDIDNIANIACDGIAYNFMKIYDGKSINLEQNFNLLIENNTEILKNCRVVNYIEFKEPKMDTLFKKYSIKAYNVTFSCDILDFSIPIYEKDNKFYIFFFTMGPCDKENVNFIDEKQPNSIGTWYHTESALEYKIIETNLHNFDFCVKLDKITRGVDEYNEDQCNLIQALKLKSDVDNAIIYCDKIKWIPTKANCYSEVTFYLWYDNPKKAEFLCNKLNDSIPIDSPYKYHSEFCFQNGVVG